MESSAQAGQSIRGEACGVVDGERATVAGRDAPRWYFDCRGVQSCQSNFAEATLVNTGTGTLVLVLEWCDGWLVRIVGRIRVISG